MTALFTCSLLSDLVIGNHRIEYETTMSLLRLLVNVIKLLKPKLKAIRYLKLPVLCSKQIFSKVDNVSFF